LTIHSNTALSVIKSAGNYVSLEMKNGLTLVPNIYYFTRLIVLGVHTRQLRKQTISLPFVFIGPSIRTEKRDFRWKRFLEISCLVGLLKCLNKFLFILKIIQNEHIFAWRPNYISVLRRSRLYKSGETLSSVRKGKRLKKIYVSAFNNRSWTKYLPGKYKNIIAIS
jgi:hypothetical protein